jgi:hypothetical protein
MHGCNRFKLFPIQLSKNAGIGHVAVTEDIGAAEVQTYPMARRVRSQVIKEVAPATARLSLLHTHR